MCKKLGIGLPLGKGVSGWQKSKWEILDDIYLFAAFEF